MTKHPFTCAALLAVLTALPTTLARGADAPARAPANAPADAPADLFDEIAKTKKSVVPGLAGNPAPRLPNIRLPWDGAAKGGFQPGDKITTQAQLDTELRRMREAYAPFMADLAPALPKLRRSVPLERFDWRIATEADARDESLAIQGKGEWKEVTVPHYGPPINKATTLYRHTLVLDDTQLKADTLFLHFDAVDYIGEVIVNGKLVGSHTGMFTPFEFDIKPFVKPGENTVLTRVRNDIKMLGDSHAHAPPWEYGDKLAGFSSPGWDEPAPAGSRKAWGWHCCAAGMGIWLPCRLESRAGAFVNDLFVRPLLAERMAEVTVEIPAAQTGATLEWSLYGQNFAATLAEGQAANATVTAGENGMSRHTFRIPIPESALRLWSPETPWLYQLQVRVKRDGQVVDAAKRQFGMREFTQSVTSKPKGRFYLNGKEIKLRGANMMGNLMRCVMTKDFDQLRDDILLAKITHMNFWRMTQQPCPSEVYDYFDKLGMLAQSDLPAFSGITATGKESTAKQFGEMMRLVRPHPSNAIISYINEPVAPGEKKFNPTFLRRKELEALFTGFDQVAQATNPGQAVKWVDGDFMNLSQGYSDHHNYDFWYGDSLRRIYDGGWSATRAGWMHGCGEFGGEALDSVALMEKHYPAEWLKTTGDNLWSPKPIPMNQMATIGARWLKPVPQTMEEWVRRSREHQEWGVRLMTESFRRMPKMNSFAVHLLIDAWPAGWMKAIMDHERQAKPAFFAYRDALTPLAVNLRPAHFYGFSGDALRVAAFVCNDTHEVPAGATLRYQVEFGGKVVATGETPAKVVACDPAFQGFLEVAVPQVTERAGFTLRVGLFDAEGKLRHDSAVPLEAFPAADKEAVKTKAKKLDRPGGIAEVLVR